MHLIHYQSPLGPMTLACDEVGLTGVWFDGQKFFGSTLTIDVKEGTTPILNEAVCWLDDYFKGVCPNYIPELSLIGSDFRLQVWRLLLEVPYGQTITYKALGEKVAQGAGKTLMSAQAIGGAVGHNPVCIIVPCHRVVSVNGALTGYAGGLERKQTLLKLENPLFCTAKNMGHYNLNYNTP